MSNGEKITYIGQVDYRNKSLTFGIKDKDRTRHTYVIGKTGMGKSTLLENLAIQDIANGEGLCFLDPHGGSAEKLLDFVPEHRVKDVVYFAPFDDKYPMGLNMLEKVDYSKRHLVANGLMASFKKIWKDAWSARMEYILNNIILALLENEGQTLLGVNRMLTDKEYRKFIISNITDPTVKDFWTNEYANYTDKFAQEAAPAIQNKVGQFFGNPLIRNILGQTKTSFDLRDLMDNKKILIVNLSKGRVGEGNANLIGQFLITKIYLAAMSRADVGPYNLEKLPPFYFYVDEFQNFANESFASILSEARKYHLALTVANQYVEQMEDEVKAAVFGNVGTMITFRVGATDAEIFEKEFAPYFIADDIVNLSARQIYLRLMIDGVGSKPFSATTLNMSEKPPVTFSDAVIAHSRKTYTKPVTEVEEEVKEFYKPKYKIEMPQREGAISVKVKEDSSRDREPVFIKKTTDYKNNNYNKTNYSGQSNYNKDGDSRKPFTKEVVNVMPDEKEVERINYRKREFEKRDNEDRARKQERPVSFDDKPATSLKDALAKAIAQNPKKDDIKNETNQENEVILKKEEPKVDEVKNKKEIPKDLLLKIIGEE